VRDPARRLIEVLSTGVHVAVETPKVAARHFDASAVAGLEID
jgi:hypothetical protein